MFVFETWLLANIKTVAKILKVELNPIEDLENSDDTKTVLEDADRIKYLFDGNLSKLLGFYGVVVSQSFANKYPEVNTGFNPNFWKPPDKIRYLIEACYFKFNTAPSRCITLNNSDDSSFKVTSASINDTRLRLG